ncbi:MAG: GDP-mannose 4,6-dehydratase [Zoogloeaceae bacterium]|jgi:nucleoside-diphosphate-sugar epimerase|nr:GDP-mannose 4,6-dehydratase [Zoogloeaceae bacterium]
MSVLITGISGFTGRYLAAELAAHGAQATGLAADLTDAAALTEEIARIRPTAVAHLAGIAFVAHGATNDFYRVNLLGTRNLLAALAESGCRPDCVLLASSANIYGNAAGKLDETTPPRPANDYAVSKLAMEHMAWLWRERLPIVIARPFNYTGVGQSVEFLIPKIVAHFRERRPEIELGNLDVWRDFSDVRVVAHIYRRLLEAAPTGCTLNLCSGKTRALREIVDIAAAHTGHHLRIKVNPAFVRANEVKSLCGDNTRLQAILGEFPMPPLEETLRWMLD